MIILEALRMFRYRHPVPRRCNLALVLLVAALLLQACAAPPADRSAAVRIAPGLDLVLPRPGTLGRSLDATQLVTAHYGDQTVVFEGQISARPDQFLLAVVDPLGRRALSVTWSDQSVTYDAAPWLTATVRPENMLADIVVLYWPEAVVDKAVRASGGSLVAGPGSRSILMGGQAVIRADYQNTGGEAWTGHDHYRNLAWGYDVDIQSVVQTP